MADLTNAPPDFTVTQAGLSLCGLAQTSAQLLVPKLLELSFSNAKLFIVKDLSRAQAIGQLFFLGLPGPQCDAATRELLQDIQPGGVIVFARSVQTAPQLRNLLDEVRELLPRPPLIGIDQEGGLVDRLRRITTPLPSPKALRLKGVAENFRTLGRATGEIMRLVGCNMNFAPVLDFLDAERERSQNGLQTRVLGYSPAEVIRNAQVYLDALQSTGVLGCLKHFPGIGAGAVDAHEDLPSVNLDLAAMNALDLAPYAHFFAADQARAVMVGHGYYPRLSPHQPPRPSSLDGHIVTNLLRQQMGFRHLVITDDLEMGAISKHAAPEQAIVQAFQAGADMVMICATPELMRRGYAALSEAVERGTISEQRLGASLARIHAAQQAAAPPLAFDVAHWQALSDEIAALKRAVA